MKILFFNLHGKSKVDPEWFNLLNPKKITFLCELGKTLSVDQVKDFLDNCLLKNTLQEVIESTNTVKCDYGFDKDQLFNLLIELNNSKDKIKDNLIYNIINKNLEKLKNFIFNKHENIDYGIKNLTLSHDDISGGSLYKVGKYLIDNKGFISVLMNIYQDGKVINKDQFYVLLDFNYLKNNGNLNIIYISPTKSIPDNLLSTYIDCFQHAYIFYDKTKNLPLEAFLDQDIKSEHLNDINSLILSNNNYQLYDFGDLHNDIVLGSCRNIEEFDFGYIV
jgi:hypothetical protein